MRAETEAAAGEYRAPVTPPRRRSYFKANVATVLAIGIAATAAWVTAMSFVEAYGLGATHLGQSADPAKRAGPGVGLYVLDGVALVAVVVLAWIAARGFRAGKT